MAGDSGFEYSAVGVVQRRGLRVSSGMLALLLMAAMVPPAVNLNCGALTGSRAQTPFVSGPDGTRYALVVISDDDHTKATHLCLAEYRVILERPGKPVEERSLNFSVDDRYGRRLALSFEGFAAPSQPLRLFGIACEEGTAGTAFAYDPATREEVDVDLRAAFPSRRVRCSTGLHVAGTTTAGVMVLAREDRLWQARHGRLRPFHGVVIRLALPSN